MTDNAVALLDPTLDEDLAISYKNNQRYDAFTAAIGKKFGMGPFSEMPVKGTDDDVYALRFGPGRGEFKDKICYLIANFSKGKTEKAGYISHYTISTLKEPVEFINNNFRLRSGLIFKKVPSNVKTFKDLQPLLLDLTLDNYQATSINTRRMGTDITQDQIDIAVANPDRTKKMYDLARTGAGFTGSHHGKHIKFAPNSIEAETFWMNRAFNDVGAAINMTLSSMKKEIDNKVGSWDALVDAYADMDAAGNSTTPESKINYDAPYILNITRTPEEIVIFDDYTRKMYAEFEKEFKARVSDGNNRLKYGLMIVTYLLITKGLEAVTSFKLPYQTDVQRMMSKMQASGGGDSISAFGKYFDEMYGIGDQRRVVEHTLSILKDVIHTLEGSKFKVKYVPDGDDTQIQFIWESREIVPSSVLKKLASIIVTGKGTLKARDLSYLLPAAISIAKRRKYPEFKDLQILFKNATGNELSFYAKSLIKDMKSRRNSGLINKLLFKMATNEGVASVALLGHIHQLES